MDATVTPTQGVSRLRWAAIAFSVVLCLGTAAELASLRHWGDDRMLPWFMTGITLVVAGVYAARHSTVTTWVTRAWAALASVGALIGLQHHYEANYLVGALDPLIGDDWETMSALAKFWAASTGAVGPTPVLAAGTAALGAIALLVATAADSWQLPKKVDRTAAE